jgi:polyvinyl alcohol dehydrogenase (cytochrome)
MNLAEEKRDRILSGIHTFICSKANCRGSSFPSRSASAVVAILCCAAGLIAKQSPPRQNRWRGREIFVQHCAACHHENSGTRAPLPSALRQMTSQQILQALEKGVMKAQGSQLKADERQAVADFLAGRHKVAPKITTGFCSANSSLQPGSASWSGWGNGSANARFQSKRGAGLELDQIKDLKVKWAFGFPEGSRVQPTVFNGRVLVGGTGGNVFSLNARIGCIEWVFKASSAIRSAISVSPNGRTAYVADADTNVYAIKTATGALIWKKHVGVHPLARNTGAPLLSNGRLYVPVSSGEEGAAINPYYACCTFRGGVVALDAASGKEIWHAYAIPNPPKRTGKNALGIPTWGPAGAAVWSAPTADVKRHAIYVGTGNNYSGPPDSSSDAILAFDMKTGRRLWSRQVTPGDDWTLACLRSTSLDRTNCPPNQGDDADFGSSPILVRLPHGRSLIVAGQKSGMVYALDPDHDGKVVWKARIGKGGAEGGVEWGGAADGGRVFFPVSDWARSDPNAGGGLAALNAATGASLWHAGPVDGDCGSRQGCSAAQIAPISVIPGVVFSGSMDGHLRAYDSRSGRVIWDFDTARAFKTVDAIPAHGGSLNQNGPVVAGGRLYVQSGSFVGMPGNILLALSVDGK